jgi:CBS domain containing-hemolysin-like protein
VTTALGLVGFAALILVSAFFVAAEFGLVAADRTRLEREGMRGSRSARLASSMVRRLSFYLSGAQLGVTLASLVLGFIAEPTLARALHAPVRDVVGAGAANGVSIALALVIATVASMVLGELIPKGIVIARPVRAVLVLARPLRIFSAVFGPLVALSNSSANWIVRRFGVEPQEELASARSLEELSLLIRDAAAGGAIEPGAMTLLTRSIRFGGKTADDAMVPRVEVAALPADATVADLVRRSLAAGYSRFPVFDGDIDNVVGLVHVKDVLRVPPGERADTPVTALTGPVVAVPETRALDDLLGDLRREGAQMAVVVDEYGGTAGIVTMEDLLEEIVGEIADEYDPAPVRVTRPSPGGAVVLPGGLHPDEVRDACGFDVPAGPYETLAGFVLAELGHLPQPGESFMHDGWRLEVATVEGHRVASVRLEDVTAC